MYAASFASVESGVNADAGWTFEAGDPLDCATTMVSFGSFGVAGLRLDIFASSDRISDLERKDGKGRNFKRVSVSVWGGLLSVLCCRRR